jgi:FlaA1/EpsC-like NDP-sugar epimerase
MTFTGFGVPVLGTIDDVARVARSRQVREVIIAIPSADRRTMRRIVERCREAQVAMKIVPGLEALLSGRARVSEIREVRLEELLRREPVRLDPSTIREALRGRRVLVTGAGGSTGDDALLHDDPRGGAARPAGLHAGRGRGDLRAGDGGEPVRIAEMARDLVRLSGLEPGRDIEIVYTGLRPGEKVAEELWTCVFRPS